MTSSELKILRLEREQTQLVELIYHIVGDVQFLLDRVDETSLTSHDCVTILEHYKRAFDICENLMHGE